jgi:hypothetical protein
LDLGFVWVFDWIAFIFVGKDVEEEEGEGEEEGRKETKKVDMMLYFL